MSPDQKIGLVLSGGGTRGLAHIGVWRVLSSLGFVPDAIAGCSIGAIVGAAIAAGKTPAEISEFALNQKFTQLFQLPITKLGLSNLAKFEERTMAFIGSARFEGLKIPLIVNATNLTTGATVVYDRGLLWPALRATIAIPGMIAPVMTDKQVLVDGGVLDQHPFSLLPKMIRRFILVNASPSENLQAGKQTIVDVLRASMNIMQNAMTNMRLAARDSRDYLVIEPIVHTRNLIESDHHFKEIIDLGETAGNNQRAEIRKFVRYATT